MWLAGFAVFVGWMLSVCLHEFGHALVAYWGGDTSVKDKGYLTLNPLKYTNIEMSLVLPLVFMFFGGIALPGAAVYIDRSKLRSRLWISAVSAAGPLANFLVTLLLSSFFWFNLVSLETEQWLASCLAFLISLQVFAVIVNLLPIPPLDGYGIIEPWLPLKFQRQLKQYKIWIFFIILLAIAPSTTKFIGNFMPKIIQTLGVPFAAAESGAILFDRPSTKLIIILTLFSVLFFIKYKDNFDISAFQFKIRNQTKQPLLTRLVDWCQNFSNEIRCAPLRKQLLTLLKDRHDTAERLITLAKLKNPGKPEHWYLEKVIYDLKRGR